MQIDMKLSRRVVVASFFALIILLVGMLFWPFVLNEIIRPVALVAWLLLRMFVLSIGQQYYWGAIIFVVMVFVVRLLPQGQTEVQEESSLDLNATITTIGYWRNLFTLTDHNVRDERTLKQELIHLLLSFYASKQRTSANFGLYEALQRGELPLPEQIHSFLFEEEQPRSRSYLPRLILSMRKTPRKWVRRWTGQEAAEHYQMIDAVLGFMETSLEMKNDERINANQN